LSSQSVSQPVIARLRDFAFENRRRGDYESSIMDLKRRTYYFLNLKLSLAKHDGI